MPQQGTDGGGQPAPQGGQRERKRNEVFAEVVETVDEKVAVAPARERKKSLHQNDTDVTTCSGLTQEFSESRTSRRRSTFLVEDMIPLLEKAAECAAAQQPSSRLSRSSADDENIPPPVACDHQVATETTVQEPQKLEKKMERRKKTLARYHTAN